MSASEPSSSYGPDPGALRVLVIGAGGMIGGELVRALTAAGAHAGRVARRGADCVFHMDFTAMPAVADLAAQLWGWDVVVNAVGVGPARSGHYPIHRDAALQLFEACVVAGVPRVVQISALGDSRSGSFLASKHEADEALLQSGQAATVIRPSLVLGMAAENTRLMLRMSRLPFNCMPNTYNGMIEPLLATELADWLAQRIVSGDLPQGVIELGGPQRVTLAQLLDTFRQLQGCNGRQIPLPLPESWMALAMRMLGWCGSSLGGVQTPQLLKRGSHTRDPAAVHLTLGAADLDWHAQAEAPCAQTS